jgi:hypothetical protein
MTGSSGTNLDGGETDPFSHLHKMSTTAGLGSGDYVAINGTAIAAILLGVGSALVLFNNLVFLLIPVIGIVAAIVAFRQISESNGTQTGREVAVIGLLLSLGFGGYYTGATVYGNFRNRAAEDQIVSNVHHLGELLKSADYPDAYAMFDDRFRSRVPLAQFEGSWKQMAASPFVGQVQSIDWNHLLEFDTDPVDNSKLATGMMLLKAKPTEKLRISMAFRNDGTGWLIDQIPQMFPADKAPAKNSSFIGPMKPQS